ncbi:Rv3235 family protein [Actinotignum timonense]|uniref:Rv3235 family protein n=1 Tax=Actinotignum timonense TaxID=1870995 RepID=UPI002A822903|nr:Rv3235 family protein [Actinotignum timonense]MDY5138830.1 Rv3235 family protein [Actinotignum timonense]
MSTAPHTENTPGATETTAPAHPEPPPISSAAGQDLPSPEEVTSESQSGSTPHHDPEEPETIRVSRLPPAPPPVYAQPEINEIVSAFDQVQLAEVTQYRAVTRHPPFPHVPHEEDTCVAENAPPGTAESEEISATPRDSQPAPNAGSTNAHPPNAHPPNAHPPNANSTDADPTDGVPPGHGIVRVDTSEPTTDVEATDSGSNTTSPAATPGKPELHQWNRLALSATPYRDIWREEMATLDDPLPPGIRPPHRFAAGMITYSIEVLLGHRAPGYVRPHLIPEVFAALVRRAGLAMRIKGKAPWLGDLRISTLKITHPRRRVAEVIACVCSGERNHAVAMRLEFLRGRWIVVALEIG